ncbi:heme ABC transporter ATP-binding protein [Gammaproteobacteria bacterium 50_400_T64]|nr:heme ABC transporter ATP-binding protein [Gammaproteobacteria bacterium 50_400_T64]
MSLRAEGASLSIHHKALLQATDLELVAGEITVICGPNGAGKTSLLRVLTGDASPSTGQVSLNGQTLQSWPAGQRAQTLAVLPQHSSLEFAFAVQDVVALGRTPHSSGYQNDLRIVSSALASVDGEHLLRRNYTELSGGEQQRVQLARVLAQLWEPSSHGDRHLLLDEPTASLDLAHQAVLLAALQDFAAQGVGICVVVHDLNLAARMADRILLMQDGAVVASGSPVQVLQVELIERVFGVQVELLAHPKRDTPLVAF